MQTSKLARESENMLKVDGDAETLTLIHGENKISFDQKTAEWFVGIIEDWKDSFQA